MRLDATRMRAALMVAGVLMLAMYLAFGGRLAPRPAVQIEFGMYPEVFRGMTVEIDGKPAGTLKPLGSVHRTAFTVEEGRHTVRVVHPLYASIERDVDVRANGRPVLLILDLQPTVNERGRAQTALAFQN